MWRCGRERKGWEGKKTNRKGRQLGSHKREAGRRKEEERRGEERRKGREREEKRRAGDAAEIRPPDSSALLCSAARIGCPASGGEKRGATAALAILHAFLLLLARNPRLGGLGWLGWLGWWAGGHLGCGHAVGYPMIY